MRMLYWLHWVCEADDAIESRKSVWTSSAHSNVVFSSRLHLSQGNTLFSLNDFGLNMAQLVLIYIPRFWIIPHQFFFTDIVVNIYPVFRRQTFASRGAAHFCRQVRNTQVLFSIGYYCSFPPAVYLFSKLTFNVWLPSQRVGFFAGSCLIRPPSANWFRDFGDAVPRHSLHSVDSYPTLPPVAPQGIHHIAQAF